MRDLLAILPWGLGILFRLLGKVRSLLYKSLKAHGISTIVLVNAVVLV